MDWAQLWEIVSLPDNIPIVAIAVLVPFYTWYAWRQARQTDRLIEELEANPEQAKTHHRKIYPWRPGWARELQVWPYLLRVEFLAAHGISTKLMIEQHFGPILFREEAIFRKEVRPGENLFINVLVTKLRRDSSRFSFRHELTRADGTLCAVMNVDGAWLDTQLRKLTAPPPFVAEAMENAAKSEDFEWI